jgi:hypothetical protein
MTDDRLEQIKRKPEGRLAADGDIRWLIAEVERLRVICAAWQSDHIEGNEEIRRLRAELDKMKDPSGEFPPCPSCDLGQEADCTCFDKPGLWETVRHLRAELAAANKRIEEARAKMETIRNLVPELEPVMWEWLKGSRES